MQKIKNIMDSINRKCNVPVIIITILVLSYMIPTLSIMLGFKSKLIIKLSTFVFYTITISLFLYVSKDRAFEIFINILNKLGVAKYICKGSLLLCLNCKSPISTLGKTSLSTHITEDGEVLEKSYTVFCKECKSGGVIKEYWRSKSFEEEVNTITNAE